MKKLFCIVGCLSLSCVCHCMNEDTWGKYDRELSRTGKEPSDKFAFLTKDEFCAWVKTEREEILTLGDYGADLELLLQDICRDYKSIAEYGVGWERVNSICRVLLEIYPDKSETLEKKVQKARESVKPGLYNAVTGAVCSFLSRDNAWRSLDTQLNAVDKKMSAQFLNERISLFEERKNEIKKIRTRMQAVSFHQKKNICALKMRVEQIRDCFDNRMGGFDGAMKKNVIDKALCDVKEKNLAAISKNTMKNELSLQSEQTKSFSVEYSDDSFPVESFVQDWFVPEQKVAITSVSTYFDRLNEDQVNALNLFLDQFTLSVNDRLLETLYENSFSQGVESVSDGWKIYNSNFSCSQSFSRGGWVSVNVDDKTVKLSFSSADYHSWKNCKVSFGYHEVYDKNTTLVAPGSIANVFYGFNCSIIVFDNKSETLFLLGQGEGERVMCVCFGRYFVFVGDLLSQKDLVNFEYADTSVYLNAKIDSGTFADKDRRISISEMNFGEAMNSFKNGTLISQEQLPLGTPKKVGDDFTLIKGSPISLKTSKKSATSFRDSPISSKGSNGEQQQSPIPTKLPEVSLTPPTSPKNTADSSKSPTVKKVGSSSKNTVGSPKTPKLVSKSQNVSSDKKKE